MKLILPALAALLLFAAPAGAMPLAGSSKDVVHSKSGIVEVQHRRHNSRSHHRHRRHHYRAGHRYRSAPPGWRRHHVRPWDWQRRGCVIGGPVWFCP